MDFPQSRRVTPFLPSGTTTFSLSAFATLFVAATPAVADTTDIRAADNALSLEVGGSYLDYAEKQGGSTLDSEKGWLPTYDLSLGFLAGDNAAPILRNLYVRLDGRASVGSTAYNGALCDQFDNCTPDQSSTDDHIYSFSWQLGRAFPINPSTMLTPFVELGYRHWDRDLQGVGGYSEAYENWDVMGGLMAQVSPANRWVLSLSGAVGSTFDATMATSGETDTLGDATTWRVQGRVGYRLLDRLELTGSVEYQGFRYGASAADVNGYYEPDSTTHQTTLLAGMSYHFF